MKKNLLLIFLFTAFIGYSQGIQRDPGLRNRVVNNGNIDSGNNLLAIDRNKKIKKTTQKIASKLTAIQAFHNKNMDHMRNAKSIIKQSKMIPYALNMGKDALAYQAEAIAYVSNDPKLLLIAFKSQREVVKKTIDVGLNLKNATKSGLDNLMSQTDRRNIINRNIQDLRTLRGLSYGLLRKLKYATDGNFLRSVLSEYDLLDYQRTINRARIVTESLPVLGAVVVPKSRTNTVVSQSNNDKVLTPPIVPISPDTVIPRIEETINQENFSELENAVKGLTNDDATILGFGSEETVIVDTNSDGIADTFLSFEEVVAETNILNEIIGNEITVEATNFENIEDFQSGFNLEILKFLADNANSKPVSFSDDNTEILISTDNDDSTIEKRISKEEYYDTFSNAIQYSDFAKNHNIDLDVLNHYIKELKKKYNSNDFELISIDENYLYIDIDNDGIFDERITKNELQIAPLKDINGIYYSELSNKLKIDKDIIELYNNHLKELYPDSYFKITDIDSNNIYVDTDAFGSNDIVLSKASFPTPRIFDINSDHFSNLSVQSGKSLSDLSEIKIQLDNFYKNRFYRIKKIEENKIYVDTNQIGEYDIIIPIKK